MHKQYFPCMIPLVVLCIFFLVQSVFQPIGDFAGYYFGSRFLSQGLFTSDNIYDTFNFNSQIEAQGYPQIFVSYTPFPPITSLVFLPFTLLELNHAKLIFNCCSVILFLFCIARLRDFVNITPFFFIGIAVVFYIPIRNNIYQGQAYLLLLCLLIEAYVFYKKEKHLQSAILWALAVALKVFPLISLLFLVLKRQWKQMLLISISGLVLFTISSLIIGYEVWRVYLLDVFPRINNGELNDAFTVQFQSMFMLIKKLTVNDGISNPHALINNPLLFSVFFMIYKVGVLSLCVFAINKNKGEQNDLAAFGLLILAAMLISPNGSSYSLVVLLVLFAALLHSQFSSRIKIGGTILLFFICNIPVHYFFKFPLLLQFPRLFLMLALFVLIISVNGIRFNLRVPVSFTLFFSIMLFPLLRAVPLGNDQYFFTDNSYKIIGDYYLKNNILTVKYLNDHTGIKTNSVAVDFTVANTNKLVLKNNQLYYQNQQLTFDNDHKKNPLLTSKNTILYLSDKNRGAGFYTLREIALPLLP